jgi:hypothetical protein
MIAISCALCAVPSTNNKQAGQDVIFMTYLFDQDNGYLTFPLHENETNKGKHNISKDKANISDRYQYK